VHEGEAMISKHPRAPMEPLSARVFRFRIARGYSIYELAKAANILATTVQRLESGKPVDKHIMPALAVALDVPLCQLVCGEHSCTERACVSRAAIAATAVPRVGAAAAGSHRAPSWRLRK
jgi:transcriptional regulator with XRE-family HTH domain